MVAMFNCHVVVKSDTFHIPQSLGKKQNIYFLFEYTCTLPRFKVLVQKEKGKWKLLLALTVRGREGGNMSHGIQNDYFSAAECGIYLKPGSEFKFVC